MKNLLRRLLNKPSSSTPVDYEALWVKKNVDEDYSALKNLTDNQYIEYYKFDEENYESLMAKYKPNTRYIRGKNPNIIFHGGCLGCASQRLRGINRCKGCVFFRFDCSKKDKRIEGEECAVFTKEKAEKLFGDIIQLK